MPIAFHSVSMPVTALTVPDSSDRIERLSFAQSASLAVKFVSFSLSIVCSGARFASKNFVAGRAETSRRLRLRFMGEYGLPSLSWSFSLFVAVPVRASGKRCRPPGAELDFRIVVHGARGVFFQKFLRLGIEMLEAA